MPSAHLFAVNVLCTCTPKSPDAISTPVCRQCVVYTQSKELEDVLEGSEKIPDAKGLFNQDCCSGSQRQAPSLTSHTLEAIQDTVSDFFARVRLLVFVSWFDPL